MSGGAGAAGEVRLLVVSNIPTPNNDALFRELGRQPGVCLRVAYCADTEGNRLWSLPREKGYDYTVMPGVEPVHMAHLNPGVAGVIARFRPHVALVSGSYGMPTFHLAVAVLAARRVPWFYWGEELGWSPTTRPRAALRRLLRSPIRRARAVLATGERARRSYLALPVPAERTAVFHYHADTPHFALDEPARLAVRAAVRAEHALGDDDVVLAFAGQLVHRKGVDVLLRAFARAAGRLPALRLLLVGDGPEGARLRAMAAELGIEERCRWTGFVQPPELPRYFAAADALVLPSRQEGWGLVVSEALAAGLPVVASDAVNAAVALVGDGRAGVVVPVDDDEALAAALGRVAGSAELRRRMSAAARETAERESPAHGARRLAAIARAVAQGRSVEGL